MRIETCLWVMVGCLGCVQAPASEDELLAHLHADGGSAAWDGGAEKPPLGQLPSGSSCEPQRGSGGRALDGALDGHDDGDAGLERGLDAAAPGQAVQEPRFAAPSRSGDLLITELMVDPQSVSDAQGEWFELYNAGAAPLHLGGCLIDDGDGEPRAIRDGVVIEPGQHFVVARSEASGFLPDYVASFSFTNSADRLAIACGGVEIDRVVYDKAAGWPVVAGASLMLDVAVRSAHDNDLAVHWCAATGSYGPELGSPGVENAACPMSAVESP